MSNYHVTKRSDSGWQYKKAGANRAAGIVKTQKEAEKFAKQICAKQGGGEVRIHSPKGSIRDSDTIKPANDPCPPKDKKF